jgi:hypothetical protein
MATKRICSIEGCSKSVRGKGWCQAHYMRWWKYGDVRASDPIEPRVPIGGALRFIHDVALKHTSDDCLNWPYVRANYGYGEVAVDGRKRLAHRIVCEVVYGPAPDGKNDAAHSCGNRLCCNPRHLRWATRAENVADTRQHGTISRGERNGHAKLTEADVRFIRTLKGNLTSTEIAKKFGVSRGSIGKILSGKNWSWLE